MLADTQLVLRLAARGVHVEQVADTLVVDLVRAQLRLVRHRDHLLLLGLRLLLVDRRVQRLAQVGDDTGVALELAVLHSEVTHHGMGLTGTGLAVREDARVETLPGVGEGGGTHVVEDVHLLAELVRVGLLVGVDGPHAAVEVEDLRGGELVVRLGLALQLLEEVDLPVGTTRHVDDAPQHATLLLDVHLTRVERTHAEEHLHVRRAAALVVVTLRALDAGTTLARRPGGGAGRLARCAGAAGEGGAAATRGGVLEVRRVRGLGAQRATLRHRPAACARNRGAALLGAAICGERHCSAVSLGYLNEVQIL
eukprot:Rhum_TRINITY_DN14749_c2_g2::Rhum_TRINITY_DN14749_c2_g2_i1::g.116580::m.116580